jgi:hypothetical protein
MARFRSTQFRPQLEVTDCQAARWYSLHELVPKSARIAVLVNPADAALPPHSGACWYNPQAPRNEM